MENLLQKISIDSPALDIMVNLPTAELAQQKNAKNDIFHIKNRYSDPKAEKEKQRFLYHPYVVISLVAMATKS